MKVDVTKLSELVPKGAASPINNAVPDWMNKAENIIKGINEMAGFYRELTGKAKAESPIIESEKIPFSEARLAKKIEMAGKKDRPKETIVMADNGEFKELLSGLIKAAKTLETMGAGNTPVGQVILELPVTLTKSREFLEKVYLTKYGG